MYHCEFIAILHLCRSTCKNSFSELASRTRMAITTAVVVLIFLLEVVPLAMCAMCNGASLYYVKPTKFNDTQCPADPCLTLSEYAQNSKNCFPPGSNTTLWFLPGEHTLTANLIIQSEASYFVGTQVQEVQTKIICNKSGAVTFQNVSSARVVNLEVLSCLSLNNGFGGVNWNGHGNAIFTNCSFINSNVIVSGNLDISSTSLTFAGKTTFLDSLASSGAIELRHGRLALLGNVTFVNNSALGSAGGGAIYGLICYLDIDGTVIFSNNTATATPGESSGGAIYLEGCNATLRGTVTFVRNVAWNGGGVSIYPHSIYNNNITVDGIIYFIQNSAQRDGGALYLTYCDVQLFGGNVTFDGNLADEDGGAMYLYHSRLYFGQNSILKFNSNLAQTFGGAIYVKDDNMLAYCISDSQCAADCFLQVVNQNVLQEHMIFHANIAGKAGDVLYGGAIDYCRLEGYSYNESGKVFDNITVYKDNIHSDSVLSSTPFKVCRCENDKPQCNYFINETYLYPGQTFSITLVAVGQRNGTAPSVIQATFTNQAVGAIASFGTFQTYQTIESSCTTLNYAVFSLNTTVSIALYTNGPCSTLNDPLQIHATILDCPNGFTLSPLTAGCICDHRIQNYTDNCNITAQTILRQEDFWIGYDIIHGVILGRHCPYGYCTFNIISFTLNETDLQCAHNRTGLLCGACKSGFSLALGSSRCLPCSNYYLFLLIPFAVAGFALVIFLLACKLTVAVGTISGLIFYANICFCQ